MARLAAGLSLALCVLTSPARAGELAPAERQKIEALIKHVGEMRDATFVRNGATYDAKTAARFLRGKWQAQAAEITTAVEFIDKAASASSTTGRPYLVRLKDGREVTSATYLRAELARLEAAGGARAP